MKGFPRSLLQVLALALCLLAQRSLAFVPTATTRQQNPFCALLLTTRRDNVRTAVPASLSSLMVARSRAKSPSVTRLAAAASSASGSSRLGGVFRKGQTWLSATKKSRPFTSTALLVCLDVFFRLAFQRAKIRFPSSLAGCGVLLAALLVLQPNEKLYHQLQPGAVLLAKWLPVFFVPSLVTLPLADGLGSVSDLIKVSLVLVGGFFFTLLTTSFAVVAVRKGQQRDDHSEKAAPTTPPTEETPAFVKALESSESTSSNKASIVKSTLAAPKPFSGELLGKLLLTALCTGVVGSFGFVGAGIAKYLIAASLLTATLASFVFGARLPVAFTKVCHPLVTCTCLTWGTVAALASITGHTFKKVLRTYRTGSVWTGAGDILLFLLGPAVVSLAVSIYDRRKLVQENAVAVGTAVGVSTLGGVFGTALAVRLAAIGIPAVRLSLVSRNITSPLAMAIASLLGADVSLAVSMVVITGLIGANFGASILTKVGVHDAVARGLGIGAAAHGLGTAALANEKDAFPFSAIAMALTASAATITVSIPVLRRIVLEMALG